MLGIVKAASKLDGQQQLTFFVTVHYGCPGADPENSERGGWDT